MPDEDQAEPAAFDSVVGRVEAQLASGRPSGAVEAPTPASSARTKIPPPATARPDFVAGVGAGIAGAAALIQLWLSFHLAPLVTMYNALEYPPSLGTRIAISPIWHLASIAVIGALAIAGYRGSRRRRWPLLVVAGVAIAIVAATYLLATMPITELAGNIQE